MLCQNCKINDSTIHLYTNLNGKQKQIDLCQNCYKIIKTDPNNSLFKGMTDLNNRDFDPFGDFFNDLNNFRPSSNTPPIPPTQSGGGYGGNGGYGSQNRGSAQTPPPSQEKGLLEEFGINVTEIARRGDIDPVIGRDDEIIRVIEILSGELQLVGATTLNEYRIIEKDAALERRMQPVKVDEPTVDETITILKGIQKKYEDYHHVQYTDAAIEAAATLSNRYIQDRFLPDKAIDLLDEAGSKMNLTLNFVDPKVIDQRLIEAENLKSQATREEDFEKAAYFRDQIAKYKEMQKKKITDQDTPIISEKTIEHIIEQKTNIPVGDLKEKEQSQLIHLAEDLKSHVIGQDDAVDKIAKAIRRNRVGLGTPNRPIGSFLFVGPTGVGKTELSKQLAIELFGSADSMIRFDMSEYMEKHSVAKLVGAPPGYVGYDEAGQLTEKVRHNPYSLILLDEVEKAHPDVMHMFLQVLDDGRLTDGQGRTVSFKDAIIIMTSNAGTGKTEASVGFGAAREGRTNSVLGELGNFFSPEFMNRFDGIIEFKALSKDNLLQIVELMLADVNKRLSSNNIRLDVTDKVKEKLVDLGYDPKMGARPLRRTIQDYIEDTITDYYLENPSEKDLKAVMTSKGNIQIKSAKKAEVKSSEKEK
ncbi:TPA: AAA family ATPase [Streptococcus pneumoniae]